MGFLLQEQYPLRLLKDGSLLLYAYGPKNQSIWFGLFFYSYFVPLWCMSFVLPFLVAYFLIRRVYLLFTIAYLLMLFWLYWPTKTNRIVRYAQLVWFFELPRYFHESSFRIMRPEEHPQLARVLELFQGVEYSKVSATSNSSLAGTPFENEEYRNIKLTPRAIIALTSREKSGKDKNHDYPCDIFSCSPHGFTCHGWGQLSFCPFFNNVQNCISSLLYYLGHGVVAHSALLGNPHSADKDAIMQTLKKGNAISIVTGGFEEASLMSNDVDKVFIKKRFGVFDMAKKYKAGIIPYFTFGEIFLYKNVQGYDSIKLYLNKYSIPGTLCIGGFLWWPRREMLHVVVGNRITPQEGESAAELKNRYIAELTALHQTYGPTYYRNRRYEKLQIM